MVACPCSPPPNRIQSRHTAGVGLLPSLYPGIVPPILSRQRYNLYCCIPGIPASPPLPCPFLFLPCPSTNPWHCSRALLGRVPACTAAGSQTCRGCLPDRPLPCSTGSALLLWLQSSLPLLRLADLACPVHITLSCPVLPRLALSCPVHPVLPRPPCHAPSTLS